MSAGITSLANSTQIRKRARKAPSAAGGRNQTSAMVRSSVANSVTLLAPEDHDGASAPVPRLLRQQEGKRR